MELKIPIFQAWDVVENIADIYRGFEPCLLLFDALLED